ncbi:MAG: c-type cytochrome [Methyloligellaceae bacterium]
MKATFTVALSVAAAVAVTSSATSASAAKMPKVTDGLLATGKAAYMRECAACHGVEGDGKGPGAHYLNPRPRDFTLGVYKLRSTPNGQVPTNQDLFRTITLGIPNSMMPSFKALSEQERWGLVAVIQRFGGIETETAKPVTVPKAPKVTAASLASGKKLYVKLKCGTCHGPEGWGDGPSSLTLKNDAKERIYPTDLTTGIHKGGSTAEDLYTRIATGLDGSPMPSYAAEAKPNEIWDLVHYTMSLASKKK